MTSLCSCTDTLTHCSLEECLCVSILKCVSVSAKVYAIIVLGRNNPLSAPPAVYSYEGGGRGGKMVDGGRGRKEESRTTEGEGLDSCLLPSLEASSSQSWGMCLLLVILSTSLFISAFCFTTLNFLLSHHRFPRNTTNTSFTSFLSRPFV